MEQGMTRKTGSTTRNQRVESEHQGHGQTEDEEQYQQENLDAPQQTTDQQVTSKQTSRGPTYLPRVWAKNPTEGRIKVDFNKRGQPVGLNKKILTEFLGTLVQLT